MAVSACAAAGVILGSENEREGTLSVWHPLGVAVVLSYTFGSEG